MLATILTNTPLWVWGLLVVLIVLGLSRTRDRELSAPRLVLMPLVIMGLAISTLLSTNGSLEVYLGAAVGVAAGIAAGFQLERKRGAARVAPGVVRIKGEWITLVGMMTIFLTRYAMTVLHQVAPAWSNNNMAHLAVALLTTFFASLMLARTALRLRVAYA